MKKFAKMSRRIAATQLPNTLIAFDQFISPLGINYRPIGSSANDSKDFLGDIDLAVDQETIDRASLYIWLQDHVKHVSNKGTLSILFPIYDEDNNQTKSNVQIDFMFGRPNTLYLMYYSPIYGVDCPEDSPLKAKHKRILISTFFHVCPVDASARISEDNEQTKHVEKWKWSMSRGVELVEEDYSLVNGEWKKAKTDKLVRALPNNFADVARGVFGDDASEDAFKSAENVVSAIYKHCGKEIARDTIKNLIYSPDANEWTDEELDYIRDYYSKL